MHRSPAPGRARDAVDKNRIMEQQDWQEPLLFDWAGINGPPITEEDLYNSTICRILRNEFYPPFHEPEYVRQKPWWNPRDPSGNNPQVRTTAYIPGKQMRIPPYPQLSTFTKQQHLFGLRILSINYKVQPWDYPSPQQEDFDLFDKLKEAYEKEQKDYRLWARMCWVNGDCIRTLHPKPLLEDVYDALFELKKNEIRTLPRNFTMAAQISLEQGIDPFEIKFIKDLKTVDVSSLQLIDYPDVMEFDVSVLKQYELPKPCKEHSSNFILPYESTVSTLPLAELHTALANYAVPYADCIASEKALQTLQQTDTSWMLPISVVGVICPESGDVKTVVVLGNNFRIKKECGALRTLKAFRYLLWRTFSQSAETTQQPANSGTGDKPKASCSSEPNRIVDNNPGCSSAVKKIEPKAPVPVKYKKGKSPQKPCSKKPWTRSTNITNDDNRRPTKTSPHMSNITSTGRGTRDAEIASCSSEPNRRAVDYNPGCSNTEKKIEPEVPVPVKYVPQEVQHMNFAGMYREIDEVEASDQTSFDTTTLSVEAINDIIGVNPISIEDMNDVIGEINCTCKGTTYEFPPPRSFKKWQVKNSASNRSFDLIIHSSHKFRDEQKEVILEPIVEWQPELGACKQSAGRLRELALSLIIRPKANLINVRLDYDSGNMIVVDKLNEDRFISWHGDKRSEIADRIYTVIDQLRFLKEGQYILKHDPSHGANAMIYSTQAVTGFIGSSSELKLSLRPEIDKMSDEEEAALAKICPQLSRAMLPYHKGQGIMPLAFTPDRNHVKEDKKVTDALAKAREPPQATQPAAAGRTKRQKKKKKKKQQLANEI